ncbi:MAG: nuclear transport factor 2 family protein, partial [Vicinamibacteraceae bacterium]
MVNDSLVERVTRAMQAINAAWLDGRVEALSPLVHPDIVMAVPGFAGRARGRETLLAGFRDFCTNATVHEFHEHDRQIDIAGNTAVVTFRYEMVYERSAERYRVTGRDLW